MEKIYLDSEEGEKLFLDSAVSTRVMRWFDAQENLTYCGIASAVIGLNAVGAKGPEDPNFPEHRIFTQTNIFSTSFAESVPKETVLNEGVGLEDLAKGIGSLKEVDVFRAIPKGRDAFDDALRNALSNMERRVVIVNYSRTAAGQDGGGHHSPIAAYHRSANKVLLYDVANFRYSPLWIDFSKVYDICSRSEELGGARGIIVLKANSE